MDISPLIIDAVVGVVLLVSGLAAYYSGLLRELLRLTDVLIAVVGGLLLYKHGAPYIEQHLFALDGQFMRLIALGGCFIVAFFISVLFTQLMSALFSRLHRTIFNRVLGLVFGLARGLLIVTVAYIGFERLVSGAPAATIGMTCPGEAAGPETVLGGGGAFGESEPLTGPRAAVAHAWTARLYCPAARMLIGAAPSDWDDLSKAVQGLFDPIADLFGGATTITPTPPQGETILPGDQGDGFGAPAEDPSQPATQILGGGQGD